MRRRSHTSAVRAFTLIELLIVLAIIGALAALSVPAFKGFGQGNALAAAERQMADDIGLARQYAIKNRALVYLVFAVPPTVGDNGFQTASDNLRAHATVLNSSATLNGLPELKARALRGFTNAVAGLFTSYAIYTEHTVGEQPGVRRPRYLTDWRELPDGIVFPPNMAVAIPQERLKEFPLGGNPSLPVGLFPFPIAPRLGDPVDAIPRFALPYIAFDSTGRLYSEGIPTNQFLTLGFGSVFIPKVHQSTTNGSTGEVTSTSAPDFSRPFDYVQTPLNNGTNSIFRIAALTGRSKLFKPETK